MPICTGIRWNNVKNDPEMPGSGRRNLLTPGKLVRDGTMVPQAVWSDDHTPTDVWVLRRFTLPPQKGISEANVRSRRKLWRINFHDFAWKKSFPVSFHWIETNFKIQEKNFPISSKTKITFSAFEIMLPWGPKPNKRQTDSNLSRVLGL